MWMGAEWCEYNFDRICDEYSEKMEECHWHEDLPSENTHGISRLWCVLNPFRPYRFTWLANYHEQKGTKGKKLNGPVNTVNSMLARAIFKLTSSDQWSANDVRKSICISRRSLKPTDNVWRAHHHTRVCREKNEAYLGRTTNLSTSQT